ncbi:glutathione S-transferase [Devosia sp. H5989]|nr:glutathione S-transferase [Devosia sp. H5989]
MTITLWGRLNSSNVQKVSWLLAELELDYEHLPLGGSFGGTDDPKYRAMNPNGKVPTLRDGDLVLWESHAIVRYLAATYASGLIWPVEPRERAAADQWTDWTATTYQPAWMEVFWNLVRTPLDQQNRGAIDKGIAQTTALQRMLDERLSQVPYLGGKEFTYADIVAGVSLYRWFTMPVERPSLPHFEAWYERLKERKAFQAAVCVSYEELVGRLAF